MKSITKLDQLLALMRKHNIDILIMSETNITDSHTFYKEGFQISYSGETAHPNAGVGFIIAPHIRPFIMGFAPHTARIAELSLRSQPRQMDLFALYAPPYDWQQGGTIRR